MTPHATELTTLGPGGLAEMDQTVLAVFTFLSRYRGPTHANYVLDMKTFLGWCMAFDVKPLEAQRAHLELYMTWLGERVSPKTGRPLKQATINRRIGTVLLFYKYAQIDDYIVKNPAAAVKRPKIDHAQQSRPFLTPLAFAALLAAVRELGVMPHASVALLGMMGLRVGEACSLNVTDVRQVGGYEVVRFIGKGGKAAEPPLPVPVMHAVHAAIGDRTEGPILLNQWGLRMTRRNITDMLARAMQMAGIPGRCPPHALRRTFCTSGLLHGVPLRDMQLAMRHADPATTIIYDQMTGGLDRHAAHRVAGYLSSMTG